MDISLISLFMGGLDWKLDCKAMCLPFYFSSILCYVFVSQVPPADRLCLPQNRLEFTVGTIKVLAPKTPGDTLRMLLLRSAVAKPYFSTAPNPPVV